MNKIKKQKNNKIQIKEDSIIEFSYNGMDCFYYAYHLNNPSSMEEIAKELKDFQKVFFKNEEIDFRDCMDSVDIYATFIYFKYLHNKFVDRVKNILLDSVLKEKPLTRKEAINLATKGEDESKD